MWEIITFLFVLAIGPTISLWSCQSEKIIKLTPVDYSTMPVISSNLPRSHLTSSLLHYNWADVRLELDCLTEYYHPLIKLASSTPDYLPPKSLLDDLEIIAHNRTSKNSYMIHQYTRGKLGEILAKLSSHLMGRPIDPLKEVMVTVGASNALDLAARAFLDPGDEVIIFEPVFLVLSAAVLNAHGKLAYVPLRVKNGTTGQYSNDWTFDAKELESKINRKTKMILLNNPNNPSGKAFTFEELTFIGYLAEKNDLVIISDEAGLWYQYDQPGHIHIASLPGLYKRTVTIFSGGKLMSNTGWKVGWVIGPEDMLWGMDAISSNSLLGVATPMQMAFAMSLEQEFLNITDPVSYWTKISQTSLRSLNKLISVLNELGAEYIVPTAGYTVLTNFTRLADRIDLSSETDCRPGIRFMTFLMKHDISVNPASLYYSPENIWRTEYVVRLTTKKSVEAIDAFGRALKSIFGIN